MGEQDIEIKEINKNANKVVKNMMNVTNGKKKTIYVNVNKDINNVIKANQIPRNEKKNNARVNNVNKNLNNVSQKTPIDHNFRGVGSFGCVVSPPLPCEDSNPMKEKGQDQKSPEDAKTLVSKIFFQPQSANDEMAEHNQLNNFDKEQQFSIKPKYMCQISTSKLKKSLQMECEFDKRKENDVDITKQIIYEDGGISINRFMKQNDLEFEKVVPLLTNLFRAVVALKKANLVHFDIKPDNIVVNMSNVGKEIRLIDFGYCRTIDYIRSIYAVKNSFVWKRMARNYQFYPVEFLYLPILHELDVDAMNTNTLVKRDAKIIELLSERSQTYSKDQRCIEFYHHLQFILMHERHTFMKEASTDIQKASDFFTEHTPEKIDIFSLGIVVYEVYRRCIAKRKVADPVRAEAMVMPILKRMTHPYVKQRITPEDALKEWEKIEKKMI